MDYLNSISGKFYLADRNYDDRDRIHQMSPQLDRLFALKQKYDPSELFANRWDLAVR